MKNIILGILSLVVITTGAEAKPKKDQQPLLKRVIAKTNSVPTFESSCSIYSDHVEYERTEWVEFSDGSLPYTVASSRDFAVSGFDGDQGFISRASGEPLLSLPALPDQSVSYFAYLGGNEIILSKPGAGNASPIDQFRNRQYSMFLKNFMNENCY